MNNDVYISLDDFKAIFLRKKRPIFRLAIVTALALFLYLVFRTPTYEAVATFQQAPSRDQGFDWKNFVRSLGTTAPESATIPLMLSRSVIGPVVEELGLQATLEKGRFVRQVSYAGKKMKVLTLRKREDGVFEISDTISTVDAHIGQPCTLGDVTLTLTPEISQLLPHHNYRLTIAPKRDVIESVKSRISIKPSREEKDILVVKYRDPIASEAALVVNTLLAKFESFLIDQNKTIIGSQLTYLDQRQSELNARLDTDLDNHIAVLKNSLQKQGFMGIQQELESILEPLKNYRSRLDEIDIELASLEEKRAAIKLEEKPQKLSHRLQETLNTQIAETALTLQKIQQGEEAHHPTFSELFTDLKQAKTAWETTQSDVDRQKYLEKQHAVATHLDTYVSHLTTRAATLHDQSLYVDTLETDFEGMALDQARSLFQTYCHQLDQLHSQLKQVVFFRDHLHDPNFELSTLTNVLDDNVTQQLVHKSSQIEAELFDHANHSQRESERLKNSLAINRRFLESHLGQTVELGKIRAHLIQEKIGALHHTIRALLKNEQTVLRKKVEQLKRDLSIIPDLWNLEKRLDFKAQLTKGMMEGLTQITESKNLSRHLYQVESKPLDLALIPLSPTPSYAVIKSIGALCGSAFLAYVAYVLYALIQGIPLSLTTLRYMGAHISGEVSLPSSFEELPSHDLETLRAMTTFLLKRKPTHGATVALLGEKGAHFSTNLAKLLSLHKQRVAVIDCNFDRVVETTDTPGVWHYLTEESRLPPFRQTPTYDYLPAGGTTRHGVEYLSSERFSELLTHCRAHYDFIFLIRQAKLDTHDALQLLSLSDLAVATTHLETGQQLAPYLEWSRAKENGCLTFAHYTMIR